MRPVVIGGTLWKIQNVPPHSRYLIDRTGLYKLATTDPVNKVISISDNITPPLLDRIVLHEVAHAISISYGLLPYLHMLISERSVIPIEEWMASFMESHSIEILAISSKILNRPICSMGYCADTF